MDADLRRIVPAHRRALQRERCASGDIEEDASEVGASLLDHGLSMIVFVACLIEFLLVKGAGTSVFFFITVATLIDVMAGYSIGIRVARRDLSIGSDN